MGGVHDIRDIFFLGKGDMKSLYSCFLQGHVLLTGIALLCYSWTAQSRRMRIGSWVQPSGSNKSSTWETILSTCSPCGIDHLCWGKQTFG